MPKPIPALMFYAIQLAFFPLALIGYILVTIRVFAFSRRTGVSGTALAPLYTRWMQHQLGTRRDEPCARLMRLLPNVSQLGIRLTTGPTLLAHRVTGYVPRIYRYPFPGKPSITHESAARTTYFDAAISRHLSSIEQFVILGAGWDTRALKLQADTRVRCFEVDTARTQSVKRRMLAKAGLDSERITFVPVDFLKQDWLEELEESGFEAFRPTFFLWEGVTMYLDQAAVESTLRKIGGTASGSVVAFDYFNAELVDGRGGPWMSYSRAALNIVGEPLRFGIENDPPAAQAVAEFLAPFGLTLEEHHTFGKESEDRRALAGLAVAVV